MAKQIIAVTGEYQKQDGTQGANFTEIGVVMISQNGKEYALLDPTVNLAGILLKQNALAMQKGEQVRDMVMCSVRERQQNQGGYQGGQNYQPPQQGYQQQPRQAPQQNYQPQAQRPHQQSSQAPNRSQPAQAPERAGFDDD